MSAWLPPCIWARMFASVSPNSKVTSASGLASAKSAQKSSASYPLHSRTSSSFGSSAACAVGDGVVVSVPAVPEGVPPGSSAAHAERTRAPMATRTGARRRGPDRARTRGSSDPPNRAGVRRRLHIGGCYVRADRSVNGFRSVADAVAQQFRQHGDEAQVPRGAPSGIERVVLADERLAYHASADEADRLRRQERLTAPDDREARDWI